MSEEISGGTLEADLYSSEEGSGVAINAEIKTEHE